jgi:hydrogenase-4 membrane subunit HyfE
MEGAWKIARLLLLCCFTFTCRAQSNDSIILQIGVLFLAALLLTQGPAFLNACTLGWECSGPN